MGVTPQPSGFFRTAAWLGRERATVYARMLVVCTALALPYRLLALALGHHLGAAAGPSGLPGFSDFLGFWTAGRLALQGHAASAYDLTILGAAEARAALLEPNTLVAFFYPPPFLLLCLPFAALPYLAGFAAFEVGQTAALFVLVRRILPRSWGYLPMLAFPGLLLNAANGQNGFISAACFAAALLLIRARPAWAGACLGLLVMKPHMALAVPVALFCARRWSALVTCGLAAATLCAVSWAVLGTDCWAAFLGAAPQIRAALELHGEDWGKLQSLYTTARLAGAPLALAYAAQSALALCVLVVLADTVRRRPGGPAELALAATAALLCTPHLLDYDLAVLAVPLAWLAAEATRTGWRDWEKSVAAAVFIWPLIGRNVTQFGHVAVAPVLLLAFFLLLCRRVRLGGGDEERMFFFERKTQKNIAIEGLSLAQVPGSGSGRQQQKFFGSFFQKRTSSVPVRP